MSNEQNGQSNRIDQARALLSPYLDDEVTPDERVLVESALDQSMELQNELASLRQTVTMVQALPRAAAPRPFTLIAADVGIATDTGLGSAQTATWWSWLKPLMGGAAVVAAVLIVGAYLFSERNLFSGSSDAEMIARSESAAPSAPAEAAMEDVADTSADESGTVQTEAEIDAFSSTAGEVGEVENEEAVDADATVAEDAPSVEASEKAIQLEAQADQGADIAAEAALEATDPAASTDVQALTMPEPVPTTTIAPAQESAGPPTQRSAPAAAAQAESSTAQEQAQPALSDTSADIEISADDEGTSVTSAADSADTGPAPVDVVPTTPTATATSPSPSPTSQPAVTSTLAPLATSIAQVSEATASAQDSAGDSAQDDTILDSASPPLASRDRTSMTPMAQFLFGAGAATVVVGLIFAALVIIWRNKRS